MQLLFLQLINFTIMKDINMRDSIILLLIFLFSISFNLKAQTCEDIDSVINEYSQAKGLYIFDKAYDLSKMFIKNDSCFFKEMYKNETLFKKWIEDFDFQLPVEFFPQNDKVDIILNNAYCERLKEMMIEKVKKYLVDEKYKQYALLLYNKLNNKKFILDYE
jgi:hypothetical protein